MPVPDHAPRWWQWPTVLSLDAPAVAVTWQFLFGAVGFVRVTAAETGVLAVSVWLAYVADRWFEGWRVVPEKLGTPRHRFYQRHRWSMAAVWAIGLTVDLVVAFAGLTRRELMAGAALLIPTLVYVLSHQLAHRHSRWRLPKEFCVAALVAIGSGVFVLAETNLPLQRLVASIALFAALCFANVALIGLWERDVDAERGEVSLARQLGAAAAVTRAFPFLVAASAAIADRAWYGLPPVVGHCVATSAILLALVDHLEPKIGRLPARVLADVVLLTPAIPLVRGWLNS